MDFKQLIQKIDSLGGEQQLNEGRLDDIKDKQDMKNYFGKDKSDNTGPKTRELSKHTATKTAHGTQYTKRDLPGQATSKDADTKAAEKKAKKKASEDISDMLKSLTAIAEGKKEVDEEKTEEGNQFSGELAKAKAAGKEEFEVDGKKYKVKESKDSTDEKSTDDDLNETEDEDEKDKDKEEIAEAELKEKAAPGQESWIKSNKEKFIKQYGKKKGMEVLYATSWKRSKKKDETKKLEECYSQAMMGGSEQESGMNINASTDTRTGSKSLTVTAQGDAAEQLAQLLKLSGIGSMHTSGHEAEMEEAYANTPEPEIQGIEVQLAQGADMHRPKNSYPKVAGGDNPMNMREAKELAIIEHRLSEALKEYRIESGSRKKLSEKKQSSQESEAIEAYGVRGLKNTKWRRTFRNQQAYETWLEKQGDDIKVQGTRKLKESQESALPVKSRLRAVTEGYTLQKTNVTKNLVPGYEDEPDSEYDKITYKIVNNNTGKVVGTATRISDPDMRSEYLEITVNGRTRNIPIYPSQDAQAALNRFLKDPKTSKKYTSNDVTEGYTLQKTNVTKNLVPGYEDEPDSEYDKITYKIVNNNTGKVVGTATRISDPDMRSEYLEITVNGRTRNIPIYPSEDPQAALNRFLKDPKTSKKYTSNDVTEGSKGESPEEFQARQSRLAAAYEKTQKDPQRLARLMKIPGYADAMKLAKDTTDKKSGVAEGSETKIRSWKQLLDLYKTDYQAALDELNYYGNLHPNDPMIVGALQATKGMRGKEQVQAIFKYIEQNYMKKGVAEGLLAEMDKSAPQPGRDGRVSHSTYGSRDKGGSKGPEKESKPITAKKAKQDALDILKKQGVAESGRDPRDWDEGNREPVNNFAIYINGRLWKVLPGPQGAYADSAQEAREYARLQDMCRRKSQQTGKQWQVAKTGRRPTLENESIQSEDETFMEEKEILTSKQLRKIVRDLNIPVQRTAVQASTAVNRANIRHFVFILPGGVVQDAAERLRAVIGHIPGIKISTKDESWYGYLRVGGVVQPDRDTKQYGQDEVQAIKQAERAARRSRTHESIQQKNTTVFLKKKVSETVVAEKAAASKSKKDVADFAGIKHLGSSHKFNESEFKQKLHNLMEADGHVVTDAVLEAGWQDFKTNIGKKLGAAAMAGAIGLSAVGGDAQAKASLDDSPEQHAAKMQQKQELSNRLSQQLTVHGKSAKSLGNDFYAVSINAKNGQIPAVYDAQDHKWIIANPGTFTVNGKTPAFINLTFLPDSNMFKQDPIQDMGPDTARALQQAGLIK